jgi:hypothetical protein
MSRCAYVRPDTGRACLFEAGANSRYCRGCEREAVRERNAFDDWMQQVVLEMETGYGFHPDDLPDCAYADWHGAGLEPEEAAREALALCMGDD